ncbi:glycosyltransferase [Ramlibacter sp. AN1015]|uniref:glycosyltransferase family 2 protein n=1 Tax=Ramlibacter sp. AN1015 TaxID=3133428 RepID=UPI0030BB44E2
MNGRTVDYIIPAYNCSSTIAEAVDSILADDFPVRQIIVVDDGSTDQTRDVLARYSCQPAVKVFRKNSNEGVAAALNLAIQMTTGDYVFRLDADDVNVHGRTRATLAYMLENDLDVCGGFVQTFPSPRAVWKYPTSAAGIRAALPFCSPFAHPSVCFRGSILRSSEYPNSRLEDLLLWRKLSADGCKFGNVPRVVLGYRLHPEQQTKSLPHIENTRNAIADARAFLQMLTRLDVGVADKLWIARRYLKVGRLLRGRRDSLS